MQKALMVCFLDMAHFVLWSGPSSKWYIYVQIPIVVGKIKLRPAVNIKLQRETQVMLKTPTLCDRDLRQTFEYQEATYYVQLKIQVHAQLRAINKELNALNRLSRPAVALAKEDARYESPILFSTRSRLAACE
jgi:hypothetical protein